MKPEDYGGDYRAHFLEQYKLYVEMVDRISQRRDQSNRFYGALLSALVAIFVVLARFVPFGDGADSRFLPIVFLVGGLFGAMLSAVWWTNIKSYRRVNSAKFEIINSMEKQLPFAGYSQEWELLRPREGPPTYFQLTRVEQFVPILVGLVFLAMVCFAVYLLLYE